jgi:hypothetical protein
MSNSDEKPASPCHPALYDSVRLRILASVRRRGSDPVQAGCELIKAPEGDLSNPIRIAAKNPTEKVYALVIVTLRAGFTRADLESYKGDGIPPSVDRIIDHMDPDLKGGWLVEDLPIDSNTEYFVVCAQEDVGILSVPLTLNP